LLFAGLFYLHEQGCRLNRTLEGVPMIAAIFLYKQQRPRCRAPPGSGFGSTKI